ncbi:MAG: hypothetical protein ACFCVD_25035 [Nodosilinea sp.]
MSPTTVIEEFKKSSYLGLINRSVPEGVSSPGISVAVVRIDDAEWDEMMHGELTHAGLGQAI